MLHILRYKIIIASLLLALASKGMAQGNLPMYDTRTWHFGFTLGFGQTNFKLNRSDAFWKSDSISSVICKPRAGFNLGVLANLHLHDQLDLRFLPSISFAQRDIRFDFRDSSYAVAKIESAYLDFPLVMKYKTIRHRNIRFYVLAGVQFSYDLQSNKGADVKPNSAYLAVNPVNFGYQIGCGLDLYFPYFKFSPELKLTNGFNNALVRDNSVYSSAIESLFSKIVQLNFYFE